MNKVLLAVGLLSVSAAYGQTTPTTRSSSTTNSSSNYNTNGNRNNSTSGTTSGSMSTGSAGMSTGSAGMGTSGTYNSNGSSSGTTGTTGTYNSGSTMGTGSMGSSNSGSSSGTTGTYNNGSTTGTGTSGTMNSTGTMNSGSTGTTSGSYNSNGTMNNSMGTSGATTTTPSTSGSTYNNNTGTYNSGSTYSTTTQTTRTNSDDPAGRNGYNNFVFGIYAGLNTTRFRGEDINTENPSGRLGYQLGLFLRGGGRLYGQIGAEYFASSSNYFRAGDGQSVQAIRDQINIQYIQVPVYIGYKLTESEKGNSAVRVQIGAEYANRISSNSGDFNLSNSEIRSGSFNALGQLGFDMGPFLIDLTYHHGLSDAVRINTFQGSQRRILSASVGFKF